ncbi:hypothetical protein BDY19DRAFT_990216 [Irpex rosettiformis]|uniref:Uncharacterized protein n=1 Tax=Irpex rosettiformis TaxID=378272 RepID=A0ACB8UEP4_9APHY|nr:hypothetical protein BDY19DRAFT_990216 [Irpex rosettiformis]
MPDTCNAFGPRRPMNERQPELTFINAKIIFGQPQYLEPAQQLHRIHTYNQHPPLSRAGAQAVRMCSPREALYIVNSLHYSTFLSPQPSPTLLPGQDERTAPHNPALLEHIKFDRSVSPRLASHSFLHMLVRQGSSHQAAKYAELMMQQNIRVHRRTTEAIVRSLCARRASLHPSRFLDKIKEQASFTPRINDIPSNLDHSALVAAQSILSCARKFGQERTERMYENLIYSCIVQGEIIVASLLFVLLVKDWQSYQARKEAVTREQLSAAALDDHSGHPSTISSKSVIQSYPRSRLPRRIRANVRAAVQHLDKPPYPQLQSLAAITSEIRTVLLRDPNDPGGEEYLQASLQALANLASLIDNDQMHFGNVSSLISLLYGCPRTAHTIRIEQGDMEVTVKAYSHFHGCLSRMIATLKDRQPAFDTRSCNSLLHYALCHRMSPRQASKSVLSYMAQRKKFNTVTANILLNSGTRLRRADINQVALDILGQTLDGRQLSIDRVDDSQPRRPNVDYRSASPKFTLGLKRLKRQEFKSPKSLQSFSKQVSADVHTLVAYIAHLTSTGRPHAVADLVFKILPELCAIDHPSWGNVSFEERQSLMEKQKEIGMQRAIRLGPYFFTALLNALAKAGRTGLTERVWCLAQQAERASWDSQSSSGIEPWLLPTHAYTIMIQCYAAESTKLYRRPDVASTTEQQERRVAMPPKPWVRGWARFIHLKRYVEQTPIPRHSTGRRMAMLIFNSMLSGGNQVISSLFENRSIGATQAAKIRAQVPVPDARFFNAVLRLFRIYPQPKARRGSNAYKRLLSWSMLQFATKRTMSRKWSPLLQDLGNAMLAANYPIPLAYRHIFVGHLPQATRDIGSIAETYRVPFTYPNVAWRPNPRHLFTTKTRGLPLRRRTKRWTSNKCGAQ